MMSPTLANLYVAMTLRTPAFLQIVCASMKPLDVPDAATRLYWDLDGFVRVPARDTPAYATFTNKVLAAESHETLHRALRESIRQFTTCAFQSILLRRQHFLSSHGGTVVKLSFHFVVDYYLTPADKKLLYETVKASPAFKDSIAHVLGLKDGIQGCNKPGEPVAPMTWASGFIDEHVALLRNPIHLPFASKTKSPPFVMVSKLGADDTALPVMQDPREKLLTARAGGGDLASAKAEAVASFVRFLDEVSFYTPGARQALSLPPVPEPVRSVGDREVHGAVPEVPRSVLAQLHGAVPEVPQSVLAQAQDYFAPLFAEKTGLGWDNAIGDVDVRVLPDKVCFSLKRLNGKSIANCFCGRPGHRTSWFSLHVWPQPGGFFWCRVLCHPGQRDRTSLGAIRLRDTSFDDHHLRASEALGDMEAPEAFVDMQAPVALGDMEAPEALGDMEAPEAFVDMVCSESIMMSYLLPVPPPPHPQIST
jgi:hypothetical protein